MSAKLEVIDLGHRGYLETLELQRELRLARLDGREANDLLLLVEHEPTYTLGRATRDESLPISPLLLRNRGATVVEIERGGDVTWHGPGQLVGYPIIDLGQHRKDLHWYLRTMESALIAALGDLGIAAGTESGKTGVWTGGRKIASIGVHVKQWVTLHGFALNVEPDLDWFEAIVPCGLPGVVMTSVTRELDGIGGPFGSVARKAVTERFAEALALIPEGRQAPLNRPG
jgi:lipoyl(octanoyl) transferase